MDPHLARRAYGADARVALPASLLLGGTFGSTAGGIKMLRVLIVLKSVRLIFARATHRRGVFHVRLGPAEWVARVAPDTPVRPDETVPVGLALSNAHLFDPDTGRRLEGATP